MAVRNHELPSAPTQESVENPFAPEVFINRLYDQSIEQLLAGKTLVAEFGHQEVEKWESSGDSYEGLHNWPIELRRGVIYRDDWADYSLVTGIRPLHIERLWAKEPAAGLSFQFATLPFNKDRLAEPDLDRLIIMNSRFNSHGTGELYFHSPNYLSVYSWARAAAHGAPDMRGMTSEKLLTNEGFEKLIDLTADVFDRSFRKPRHILRPSAS